MKIETIKASKYSYKVDFKGRPIKRNKATVKYIVIHYTGVKRETARNEGACFARNNSRYAGAHFFVDRNGNIVKSVPMNYTAWSVGGKKYTNCQQTGGGRYYGSCTNSNSVSIEMCDTVDRDPSDKQIKAIKWLISYIRSHGCSNAHTVIRHFDVTGKPCPARFIKNSAWASLKKKLGE